MAVEKQLMTADEFEEWTERPENRDRLFELIHGEIVEKVPTEEHGYIILKLGSRIVAYIEMRGIGRVVSDARHRLPGEDYNARQPDISYYADATRPIVRRGSVYQTPDLAIEIKSPTDTNKLLREKANYYLATGASAVWLVFPEKRLIEVHTPDDYETLTEADTLDGGDVLPGFTLPVRDIFPA